VFCSLGLDVSSEVGSSVASDHFPLFGNLNSSESGEELFNLVEVPKYGRIDRSLLTEAVSELSWLPDEDPVELADKPKNCIFTASDMTRASFPRRNNPWWTLFLTDLRKRSLNLLAEFKSRPSVHIAKLYGTARTAYHLHCRIAKRLFFTDQRNRLARNFGGRFRDIYKAAKSFLGSFKHCSFYLDATLYRALLVSSTFSKFIYRSSLPLSFTSTLVAIF